MLAIEVLPNKVKLTPKSEERNRYKCILANRPREMVEEAGAVSSALGSPEAIERSGNAAADEGLAQKRSKLLRGIEHKAQGTEDGGTTK